MKFRRKMLVKMVYRRKDRKGGPYGGVIYIDSKYAGQEVTIIVRDRKKNSVPK